MLEIAARILLSYLLGSVNGSLLLGRLRGVDIRTMGSGNAGGTNALRTQGVWFALGAVIIDVGKGWLAAAWIGQGAVSTAAWLPIVCGATAVVGHVYPVFHGFRGGKGAATLGGVAIAVASAILPLLIGVWLLCVMVFGFVGLATMVTAVSGPLWLWAQGAELGSARIGLLALLAVFVIFTHRSNIRRMWAGNEPRAERLWLLGRWLARRRSS
jgi:glycerol-3-phosphate acyltransferase PlsY